MTLTLIGGSFNPPHKGHIQTANIIKKVLGITQITFLVTPQNPFKSGKNLLTLQTRVKLLKQLTNKPWFEVSTMETRFKVAQSINTIRFLRQRHPKSKIYFIMGTDNLAHFHLWQGFNEILEKASVIFVNRGGHNLHKILRNTKVPRKKFKVIYTKTIELSSTQIRKESYKF